MDSISLLQTAFPLVTAVIFTGVSISSLEGLFVGRNQNVLAPVWCALAAFSWIGFSVVNLYGLTSDYFSAFSYLYMGIGIFFLILMAAAIIMDVDLAGKSADQKEMEIS